MPLLTSGNTDSPTLMMAGKEARWIGKDARGACCGFAFDASGPATGVGQTAHQRTGGSR